MVKENDKIKIEKLKSAEENVDFETLLLIDGENVEIGAPKLDLKVSGKIVGQGKAKKVTGVKFKRKTRQSKRFGHRQPFTEVAITKI